MDRTEVTDARMAEASLVAAGGRMTVPLADGITLGETTYVRATLRQLTAGDILEAQEEAERLVYAKDGTLSLVMSPARMGREALRRQVARLEGESGPSKGRSAWRSFRGFPGATSRPSRPAWNYWTRRRPKARRRRKRGGELTQAAETALLLAATAARKAGMPFSAALALPIPRLLTLCHLLWGMQWR